MNPFIDEEELQAQAINNIKNAKAEKVGKTKIGKYQQVFDIVKNLGVKNMIYGLAGLTLFVAVGTAYRNAQTLPEQEDYTLPTFDEKTFFTSVNPLMMTTAVKGSAQSSEYKKALGQAIVEFDSKVLDSLQKNLEAKINTESVRLRDVAVEEARSGTIVNSDRAQQIFDMANCPTQTLEPHKCVLLRYAVEGLDQVTKGNQTGDINQIVIGYVRYRASMIALGGNAETQEYNFYFAGIGMEQTIRSVREIITIAPGVKTQVVSAPIPGANQPTSGSIGQNVVETTTTP